MPQPRCSLRRNGAPLPYLPQRGSIVSIHRQDQAQPANPSPLKADASKFAQARPTRPKRPARGKILCVFSSAERREEIEPQISEKGYSLLRARPGIHAYWLAITSQPDAIVTDMTDPGPDSDSAYLLDCLHRNKKTIDIPVIAILESTVQASPEFSGLSHAKLCIRGDAETDYLLEKMDGLIDSAKSVQRSKYRRADSGHASEIDAVFSEIGGGTTTETQIPLLGPIRMPLSESPIPSI